jgi:hypothetical protein
MAGEPYTKKNEMWKGGVQHARAVPRSRDGGELALSPRDERKAG